MGINGKSWPNTERLIYPVGRLVRWRWINATDENHPLHLHGHCFLVEAIGDQKHWEELPVSRRRRAVTEVLPSGSSFTPTWLPERAGKWLFHCHVLFHISPELRQTPEIPGAHHEEHDASRHMAGLVLGITIIQPRKMPIAVSAFEPRRLRLVVGQREGVQFHGLPGLGYELADAGDHGTGGPGVFTSPGPPIVLTRGQPVEIAVENRLPQSTSVHWHGIELESYYDGVPGWGGEGRQVTPPIGPGETFAARFTPPRAGTFMYHTHLNDYVQLSTGLYGALIVVEPGQRYDPESDKIFIMSRGGSSIAKDGARLPPSQTARLSANVNIYPGETYDFEFRPALAGAFRLTASQPVFKLQTFLPVVLRRK